MNSSINFPKIFLITGNPGVGKTTLIQGLYQKLSQDKTKTIKGFYTEEIRENGQRSGFDVVNLENKERAPLARIFHQMSRYRVGKYGVEIENFEQMTLPIFKDISQRCICIIDEIGKMEATSKNFERLMLNLLDKVSTENFLIIATVPTSYLSLSDKFKQHPKSKIFEVTFLNRNNLADQIFDNITEAYNKL
ncbi:unnamed protein product [Brachionus calyciflorus]|uniref:AAA+ ATPase domain-containing protein n=1 Tax=Brachionus calyciflorus TaxID=104777 RepID=A0A813TKX1_9BILA|nr:unnamed protein product [Brachionus calyciflorus]